MKISKPMSPKERAIYLHDRYYNEMFEDMGLDEIPNPKAKQATLIALDEIIEQWEYIDTYLADGMGELNPNLRYWYEVRQELNAL